MDGGRLFDALPEEIKVVMIATAKLGGVAVLCVDFTNPEHNELTSYLKPDALKEDWQGIVDKVNKYNMLTFVSYLSDEDKLAVTIAGPGRIGEALGKGLEVLEKTSGGEENGEFTRSDIPARLPE